VLWIHFLQPKNVLRGKHLVLLLLLLLIQLYSSLTSESVEYLVGSMITSFMTIVLGLLICDVRWPKKYLLLGLDLLPWTGLFCVILGVVQHKALLDVGRIVTVGLPSHLPFWTGMGLFAALYRYETTAKRKYLALILLNVALTGPTLSRGGILFIVLISLPYVFRIAKRMKKSTLVLILCGLAVAVVLALFFLRPLIARTAAYGDNRRWEAWARYLYLLNGHYPLGMGLGYAKTIVNDPVITKGFNAVHNEYIRFLFETGIVGSVIMVVLIGDIFRKIVRVIPKPVKQNVLFLLLGFLVYSLTDNTISAIQFWAPLMLCLSLTYSAYGGRAKAGEPAAALGP
jgi:teichuronic acid biosynthesis protein TuaE